MPKITKKYSKSILKISKNKPVSLEVFGDDFNSMQKQALKINEWGKNVYVKIPITNSKGKFMGKLIKDLNQKKIMLNITAVYSFKQTKEILRVINKKTNVIISILQEGQEMLGRIQSQNSKKYYGCKKNLKM